MYCNQCGAKLLEGANFCIECGHPVGAPGTDASAATTSSAWGQRPQKITLVDFYLSAEGRVTRKQYWLYLFLPLIAISIVSQLIDLQLGTFYTDGEFRIGIIGAVVSLLTLVPSIIVQIKRYHDRDKSGWWLLLMLLPVIGWIWIFVELGFLKGTDGDNRFGPPVPADATLNL